MNDKQAESIIDFDDKSDVGKTNIEADEADKLESNAQLSPTIQNPAMEMVLDKLCWYVCHMLASHGVVMEAFTWERVQQEAMVDPVIQELRRLLEEGFP